MGRGVKGVKGGSGGAMLEPEEALFLCERGSLDLRFGHCLGVGASLCGLPMSLQAVYACCIGARGLTLERYIVYAGLKRDGYVVFRAKGFDEDEANLNPFPLGNTFQSQLQIWFQTLLHRLTTSVARRHYQPLIGTSFFRDYSNYLPLFLSLELT